MSDSLKRKFKAKCERKGWDVLKPSHVNIYPDDALWGDACKILGVDGGDESINGLSMLVVGVKTI